MRLVCQHFSDKFTRFVNLSFLVQDAVEILKMFWMHAAAQNLEVFLVVVAKHWLFRHLSPHSFS